MFIDLAHKARACLKCGIPNPSAGNRSYNKVKY